MTHTGISCYCATYGRPKRLLENSIQCFLDQDYSGPKELVILNDCKYQKYVFDHPEVKIVNLEEKIPILGVKFNETVKLCKYDLLATWEDDDIFLKHRLSYSSSRLKNNLIFHTYSALIEEQKQIIKPFCSYCHSTHLIDKNLFYDIGGYKTDDRGSIDIDFIKGIVSKLGRYVQPIPNLNDRFYIYRWNSSQSYHASAIKTNSQASLSALIEERVLSGIEKGNIESGEIILNPKLSYNFYDYLPAA